MIVEQEVWEAVTIVRVGGELHANDAGKLEAVLNALYHKNARQVLLDIETCRFCDSESLFALLHSQRRMLGGGGIIKLYRPSPEVVEFLHASSVEELFEAFDSRPEALNAFRRQGALRGLGSGRTEHPDRRRLLWRVALDQRCAIGMLIALLKRDSVLRDNVAQKIVDQMARACSVVKKALNDGEFMEEM